MKVVVDAIFSIDLPEGPPQLPPDPEDCWVVVMADIGTADSPGYDEFTFYVCTIKKLQAIVDGDGACFGKHLLVVNRFDWNLVEQAINDLCDSIEGDSWEDIASKLSRYGQWEFQDYRDAEGTG